MIKRNFFPIILLLAAVLIPGLIWGDEVIISNGAAGFSGSGGSPPEGAVRDTTCPVGSLYSQPPHQSDESWSAATSEVSPVYEVYDNYTNAGGTTDIRFWGLNAYNDGVIGWTPCSENPMTFTITFYTDAGGTPGTVIATYTETLTGVGTGTYYATSYELMEYNTVLSPAPSLGTSPGWVSIVGSGDPNCWFLWMSSGDGPGDGGYQWDGTSLNVYGYDDAFCLYSTGSESEDWGDCPDTPYPTLAASNGAVHPIIPGMFLGYFIDPEADGQPSPTALLDDFSGAPDDEDGVVFTQLITPGSSVNVKVIASMPGFLDAWVDWNFDGDWADAGEAIFVAQPLNPGINMLAVSVPSTAGVGQTFGRFRYSSIGGLSWDGPAPDGEVEDYRIFIQEHLEGIKWYQGPDLDNTGMDVDFVTFEVPDVDALADDFLCMQTGPITDIHFWASFFEDLVPDLPFQAFEITIYSDIPAGVMAPWSMPGDILWRYYFDPGSYQVYQVTDNNPEDYFWPAQQYWVNDEHFNCYQYDFFIPPEIAFVQNEGTIYWLGIRDLSYNGSYRFGWKTTTIDERWNDDATFLCDPPMYWCELRYPPGHEFEGASLDLAFAITMEAPCDCIPGDANGNTIINILDITYLIDFLYGPGPAPTPYALCSGDANCDCVVNILDITYLIAYLYQGGPPPCTCEQWLINCGPPLRK